MSRVVAIVQARLGSTRLPGKALVPIQGKPMLQHVLERLARATRINETVVATSDHPRDAAILACAEHLGFRGIAGNEDDVLARYIKAARFTAAEVVVRITADCPLIDPALADDVIEAFLREDADYAANVIQRTFPRGVETEVFWRTKLEELDGIVTERYEREHVTPYFYLTHPEKHRLVSVEAKGELRRPDLRLCVDTPEDLRLVREIFARLAPQNPRFTTLDVIRLLDAEAALKALNAGIKQKELEE
ncbi:MAG: glycosyltransferase family protein [Candidatus Hydrogenedentes bacterium]|nr:glycosyltransferase family protein [Candidatus Hydrogenedentota bacterium]